MPPNETALARAHRFREKLDPCLNSSGQVRWACLADSSSRHIVCNGPLPAHSYVTKVTVTSRSAESVFTYHTYTKHLSWRHDCCLRSAMRPACGPRIRADSRPNGWCYGVRVPRQWNARLAAQVLRVWGRWPVRAGAKWWVNGGSTQHIGEVDSLGRQARRQLKIGRRNYRRFLLTRWFLVVHWT
jgi:hypothetical protein